MDYLTRSYGERTGNVGTLPAPLVPLGFQQLTNVTNAAAVSLTPPAGALVARIVPDGAIRWRDDGTAPTAAVGMPVTADDEFEYSGNLAAIKFIAQSATTNVNVSHYG